MIARCRAVLCSQNHAKHFCNICDDQDSQHLEKDCPQGIILYHGTKESYIKSIMSEGLRPSQTGRLGPGIYFADFDVVVQISKHRGKGEGFSFIECRVNPNFCQKGIHPIWKGVTKKAFGEWCLLDQTKYTFISVNNFMNFTKKDQVSKDMVDNNNFGDFSRARREDQVTETNWVNLQ